MFLHIWLNENAGWHKEPFQKNSLLSSLVQSQNFTLELFGQLHAEVFEVGHCKPSKLLHSYEVEQFSAYDFFGPFLKYKKFFFQIENIQLVWNI